MDNIILDLQIKTENFVDIANSRCDRFHLHNFSR